MTDRHGDSFVTLSDNIIKTQLIGSFNRLGVEFYASNVKAVVAQLGDKPFAMLVDDLKVEGGTPAAFEALDEYNQWMNTQQIVAKAIVIDSIAQVEIIKARTPAFKNQNIKFFVKEEDALIWLEHQLADF